MLLKGSNQSLQVKLGASVGTQLKLTGHYDDWTLDAGARASKCGGTFAVTTNNTTAVEVMPAPPSGHEYELRSFYVVQPNASAVRVVLEKLIGGVAWLMLDHELSEGDNMRIA